MAELNSLNPEQRKAAQTIEGPVLILAGAGTGKTNAITHRVAYMVDQGISPENILAVTFTNKAAREMHQRVTKLIPHPPKREDGKPLKATVCTFHSLCVRILRRHIDKLGYKRNFVIYSESEQLGVVKKSSQCNSRQGCEGRSPRASQLVESYQECGVRWGWKGFRE